MDKLYPFEYAVIRVVPRVEKEEFVNAGIILYSKRPEFLGVMLHFPENKILALDPEADLTEIRLHLEALKNIAEGKAHHSPISSLDAPSRYRWLSAKRSTVVQTSPTHSGLCTNSKEKLDQLFKRFFEE